MPGCPIVSESRKACAPAGGAVDSASSSVANSEPDLVQLYDELEAHGRVLVVVDE